jgi:putative ABC transport system substrate-binding protein
MNRRQFITLLGGRKRIEALIVQPTLPRAPIAQLVQKHRIPAVSGNRAFADAGGLMSYAGSLADRYRNAATTWTNRLGPLAGHRRLYFSFGLTVSSALLARADEEIE